MDKHNRADLIFYLVLFYLTLLYSFMFKSDTLDYTQEVFQYNI
jgi:hypothetical protein